MRPARSAVDRSQRQLVEQLDINDIRGYAPIPWLWLAICETGALLALFAFASFATVEFPISLFLLCGISISAILTAHFLRNSSHMQALNRVQTQRVQMMFLALASCPPGWALALLMRSQHEMLVHTALLFLMGCAFAIVIALSGNVRLILVSFTALIVGVAFGLANPFIWLSMAALVVAGGFLFRSFENRERSAIKRLQWHVMETNRAQAILSDFEDTGHGWFWETDRHNRLTYLSPRIARLLGHDHQTVLGQPISVLLDRTQQEQERTERTITFHLSARSGFSELAVRAAMEQEERWWSVSGRPNFDKYGNYQGFRGSGTDLTEMRKSQAEASRLAHYDSLTGLSNRLQMQTMLDKLLASPSPAARVCSLLLLDLDRFKEVNDTLGHPAGDALLKQVSQRLERMIGSAGRVGRLGGDEFQVILPGVSNREELALLADQVIQTLSEPYAVEGSRVTIGASVGVAVAPDDGFTSDALIRNADLALYAAKGRGRGVHHFYAPDLHSDAEERRQLEIDLRDALTHGGLQLVYQPVVQVTTEEIVGFEALLRWMHPVRGAISPSIFVPIAEDAGLIAQIGEWSLRTACAEVADWPGNVRVAVNVSPIQFANPGLPAIVANALASAGLPAERLELEITESVFLNDDSDTDAMFKALKGLGVRLALDDFGTGYSSLGYLKKAPFDKIKIDQSFVRGATQKGSRNGAIIRAIVSLAEALGMDTTAEGVETHDELALVRSLGCSHIQGYIYSKPLPASKAQARLAGRENVITAEGFSTSREVRKTVLRTVAVIHQEHRYEGRLRNLSASGALIEGLWNVPPGTDFLIDIGDGSLIRAVARWAEDDRMGLEFLDHVASTQRPETAVAKLEEAPALLDTGKVSAMKRIVNGR